MNTLIQWPEATNRSLLVSVQVHSERFANAANSRTQPTRQPETTGHRVDASVELPFPLYCDRMI